jgi:hypothetical protein
MLLLLEFVVVPNVLVEIAVSVLMPLTFDTVYGEELTEVTF